MFLYYHEHGHCGLLNLLSERLANKPSLTKTPFAPKNYSVQPIACFKNVNKDPRQGDLRATDRTGTVLRHTHTHIFSGFVDNT